MIAFLNRAVLAALALLAPGAAPCLAAAAVPLTLRASVTLDHPAVVLADLVDAAPGIDPRLLAMPLGAAPRVGYVLHWRRADLAAQLRRQGANVAIDWQGASAVSVATLTQRLDPQLLQEAAVARLAATFGEPDDAFNLAPQDGAVDIPQRPYALRTRPVATGGGARVLVWVDVLVDGAVYRSVVVPATVTRMRAGWVARRALAAGSRIDSADVEPRQVNAAGLGPLPDAVDGARLRGAVRAGEVLTMATLAPTGAVLRGDAVRLTIQSGALAIEAPGVAQGSALPGQLVAVRSASSGEILSGRVNRAGNVLVE